MGSIKVRNPLKSKRLKRIEKRIHIIDEKKIRVNKKCDMTHELIGR